MEQNISSEQRSYVKSLAESSDTDMRTFWFAFVVSLFFVILLLIPHAS